MNMWSLRFFVLSVIFDTGFSTAVVEITGAGLILVDGTTQYRKKYSYNFKKQQDLKLTCTVSGVINDYEIKLENEHGVVKSERYTFSRRSPQHHSVTHKFRLSPSESRSISCSARDVHSTSPIRFRSTIDLIYNPDPTTAPSTPYTNTPKPTEALPVELSTAAAEQQPPEDIPWKLVAIGMAGFVTLFIVIAGLAMLCRQKKPQSTDSDYANLTNDIQHEYLTMPVPVPAPRKPVPTVEGTYSEPKDSNDMSEALYADPNAFSAVKSEETYAEPYNAKNELYTTPIPKAQRGKKLKDDPNYSNVFGKDYVNSKSK